MGLVHVLAPEVADRIAAGEVVERPASVVRELLDNALDAAARRIEVSLESGGQDRINVSDDGRGMDAEDTVLAFQRHATSKIRTSEDLVTVSTLGFRGEALAAIAAVSRVVALSRPAGSESGTRVTIDRGTLVSVEPAARAVGTTIEVRDLFIGVPARRKFLRSEATELDHCLRAVRRVAIARPEVAFRVLSESRCLLDLPPVADGGQRISAVFGEKGNRAFLKVDCDAGPIVVRGWAARADVHRGTREDLHISVNGRPVRDSLLVRAVVDAYRNTIPAGRYPMVVLDIRMPPDAVDVNVHPAKSEVRFQRPQEVRAVLVAALREALGSYEALPHYPSPASPAGGGAVASGPVRWGLPWERNTDESGVTHSVLGGVSEIATDQLAPSGEPPRIFPVSSRRSLAQYRNCYILAEDAEGLMIVDQHVAHERLLYEMLLRQAEEGPLPRQACLFPEVIEVGAERAAAAETCDETLRRCGFILERFGETSIRVAEVPAVYGRTAPNESVRTVLDEMVRGDRRAAETLFRNVLATVACHSAVRKGQELSREKMDYILRGLDACDAPHHCPHGRVVSLRLDLSALDRNFGRT